jgi:hypothetical protein
MPSSKPFCHSRFLLSFPRKRESSVATPLAFRVKPCPVPCPVLDTGLIRERNDNSSAASSDLKKKGAYAPFFFVLFPRSCLGAGDIGGEVVLSWYMGSYLAEVVVEKFSEGRWARGIGHLIST